MKFMEKAKRFFTLKRRANDGFTLVELIVVIAILAILAGVAVPAYSGYIKKAEKAGDMQLLGAVNEAYAAACMAAGEDIKTLTPSTARMPIVEGKIKIEAIQPATVVESFALFFQGNEDSEFKVVTALQFNPATGAFEEADSSAYDNLFNNIIDNNAAWVTALNSSIWMNNDKGLGTDGLLNKVNDVTIFAAGADSDALNKVLSSTDFQQFAGSIMGAADQSAYDAKMADLVAKMKAQNPGMTDAEAQKQIQANAVVLYTADKTSSMQVSDITGLLGAGNATGAKQTILNNLNSGNDADKGLAMSQAAAAYGMYTAYAYATNNDELIKSTNNPLDVMDNLSDPTFQAWVTNPDNAKDIEGYLAAMSMVSTSKTDMGAIDQLMVNGFDDPALSAMLNQMAGVK